jgi:hypothetical protein
MMPGLVTRTKVVLLLLLTGLMLARGRSDAWPLVGWSMFAMGPRLPPPERIERVELRVLSRDGHEIRLTSRDFLPYGREEAMESILVRLVNEPDRSARCALLQHVSAAIADLRSGVGIVQIEEWVVAWRVDLRQVPPLDAGRPVDRRLVGRDLISACAGEGAPSR